MPAKADILARLQRDILLLQGIKSPSLHAVEENGLGRINDAFPNGVFPRSALHEFFCTSQEGATASMAFISGLISALVKSKGVVLWISSARTLFPPALKAFGIDPEQVIFLELQREKEVAWAVEEALKCRSLSAVVGEMQELSFTASRRYQLAIEQSGVGCFVIRRNPKNRTTASVTRWQVETISSGQPDDLPGVGHPRWQVSLLKVRNGKPGSWDVEWVKGSFHSVSKLAVLHREAQKKTG